jgi:DNA (cytosine-5)-methyltransferase 1
LFTSAPWRTARDHVIDWSIPGKSIFDRKRPLAPKTLARIAAGIVKFGWPAPFIVVLRNHCDARGIDLPLPTITTSGAHLGLVQPFIFGNRENNTDRSLDEPIPTATTAHGGRIAVVEPFVLSQASGGAPRAVQEPLPTVPGGGAHALIAPYYGSGSGETCRSVDEPLPTATAKARFGLVVPVTHHDGSNRARSLDEPLPTLTTAKRGELAFITAQFGERPTQVPRVHSVDEPAPTICATGHTNLVTAGREYDILFRMLEPHELAAAMSISTPERPYHFAGNKTEVVRQIGQAVPRLTARSLAFALMRGPPPRE